MGWLSPDVILANNDTLSFTRQLVQLKLTYSQFLVFGRLMRPPTLTAADGGALRELEWCLTGWAPTCCQTTQVIGQLWMDASQGSLGLALANPTNATVSVGAALRVDGHTHLLAGGRALIDGVPLKVGDTHLELTKTLQPYSACVVTVAADRGSGAANLEWLDGVAPSNHRA